MTDTSQVAIVVGAARGIGRAVAERLAAKGIVIAAIDRLADTLADTAADFAILSTLAPSNPSFMNTTRALHHLGKFATSFDRM